MSTKKKVVAPPQPTTRVTFAVGTRTQGTKRSQYGWPLGDFGNCTAIESYIAKHATRPYALEVDSNRRIGVWTVKFGQLAGMKTPAKSANTSIPEVQELIDFINNG